MLDEPVVLEDLAHQALAASASGASGDTARRLGAPVAAEPAACDGAEALGGDVGRPARQEWGRLIVPRPRQPTAPAPKMVLERARRRWRCTGWSNGTAPGCNSRRRAG